MEHISITSANVLPRAVENSWSRILDYIPDQAHGFIKALLKENPANVVPVSIRSTKQGDCHRQPNEGFHKITVNKCGNPYQFLITLIHELAHARAYREYGLRIRPHGREWRITFSAFLHRSLGANCYPNEIVSIVRQSAFSPTATSSLSLEKALRQFDKLDKRPLVSELPEGTLFSLRSGVILQKGKGAQNHFRCKTLNGVSYRVSASTRIHATYEEDAGTVKLATGYQALTKKLVDEFEEYDLWFGYVEVENPDKS